jgi:hypothetical protein
MRQHPDTFGHQGPHRCNDSKIIKVLLIIRISANKKSLPDFSERLFVQGVIV